MPKTKTSTASKQSERTAPSYKFCLVPKCNSTTSRTPLKTFFRVPRDFEERKKWFEAAGLEENEIRITSLRRRIDLWICEDHFDPEKDVIMFPSRKRKGFVKAIQPGAVPHLFECQRETGDDRSPPDTCATNKQSAPPNSGDRPREEVEEPPPAVENAKNESVQRVLSQRLKVEPPEEKEEPLVPPSVDRENPTDAKIVLLRGMPGFRGEFDSSDDSDAFGQKSSPAQPPRKQQMDQRTKPSSARTPESTRGVPGNLCRLRVNCIGGIGPHILPREIAKMQYIPGTVLKAMWSNRRRPDDSDDDESEVDKRANINDNSDDDSDEDNRETKRILAPAGSDTEESIEGSCMDHSEKIEEKEKKLRSLRNTIYDDATELLIEEDPFSFVGILKDDLSIVDSLSQAIRVFKKDIYLIMVKIRLNLPNAVLSAYFGIEEYAIVPRMQVFLPKIAIFLNNRMKVPKMEDKRLMLPAAFSALVGRLHSIVHFFTLRVDKPIVSATNETRCRRYLISVDPDGIINYLSNGFSGESNDIEMVRGSEYLDVLPSKVAVLADRNYEALRSILNEKNCTLLKPPIYLVDRNSSEGEEISIFVKSAETYVEKIIDRLKEFQFIDHFRSSRDNLHDLDCALIIAAALVNLQTINAM